MADLRATRHHVPPPPGADQPLHGARQGGGGAGFATVNGRLFAPLQGLAPNNVLQGGYGWLDPTDGGATLHPGLDLNAGGSCNADEGLLVVAPLGGVVRAALRDTGAPGEGNHVWVELDDPANPGPAWWHTDHLLEIACGVGQRLAPGEPIGLCGRSGGWDCAHAHTELLRGPPQDGFYQWPYGWSRSQVEAAYWNPSDWWNAATALVLAKEGGVSILSDAQQIVVQAAVWGPYWDAAQADFAIPASWRAEWVAGRWPGPPLGPEQPVPEDGEQPAGSYQVFQRGVAAWLPGQPVSWEG